MKNNFLHAVFRFAVRIFIALRMRIRLLPPCTAGYNWNSLLKTSFNVVMNRLFWHRRKQAGFRVIKSVFRPVARNGIQQWLPDTLCGS
jgi:hypothetical protein